MAYNLFDTILKMVNPETKQAFSQAGQEISKTFSPLTPVSQGVSQAITKTGQELAKPFIQAGSNIVTPVKKQFDYTKKVSDYYKPFRESINQLGLTAEDIAQIPEDKKEQILSGLREIGVTLPEMPKPLNKGEDLGIMGNIKEGAIGAFRAGEQIPTIVGSGLDYLTQNVTSPLVSGGLEMIGAEGAAQKFREASKKTGEFYKKTGEDITMAGMTDGGTNPLTQKQIDARKFGGQMALTAPIGGGYVAGAKGVGGLALRSGVVGAGFGATQPIIDKGAEATMGDIATGGAIGGVTGAVAGPLISKVLKYGQAGYRGGLTGMGKSIARDTKAGIQAITPSGANISTKANRFNANEIREFTKTTGQSPGDFATSRGMTKVGDDAVVEATNLWKASKDQADEALQAIKGRFRFTDEGEDLLKTTIDDLETRLANTKSPDAKRISQLKAKYEDSGLTMSEINEVKRAYSNNYKYSFVDAGSESALRSRNLQDAVRKWQFKVAEENGLTNLKEINKTTQGWKMFADSLSKKIQGSSGNNNVSLTDWIALSGGSPENIALYLGKKLASSDKVKSGAIKLFSKKTKPSIIQASKADIQRANFQKDVNRGVSGVGDNSGGKSLVKPVGLLTAPTGKATGAKNIRVNQKIEKSPVKNEGQVGNRPGTATKLKTNAEVQLAKETARKEQITAIEKELNTNLLSKYNPDKPKATRTFIETKLSQGKITREEGIEIVEKLYDNANGFDKPHYEKILEDLYSNKKIESFDDLLNEKQVQKEVKTPRQEFLETPEGIYEEINKKANDRRFNPEKANTLIAKFKEKTGIDLMKNPNQKFDEKGNVIKPIVKPNTIKNESKVNKPVSSNETTNVFGETIKKPSNKKGGFIKIPEIGKKVEPLIEEARKYKSAEEFVKNNSLKSNRITSSDDAYQKGGYDGVLNIVEDADNINLTLIELKEKGTGKGTEIIKELKQYADANNKKLKIINSSNDKYWNAFKFFEKGVDGRYVYKPNSKPFIVEGRRGLDYETPKKMIGKEVSYNGKNYEITGSIYSDESGTLYYKIKGSDGSKVVTPDKLSEKIGLIVQNDKEITPEVIKPKRILGKRISKEDEQHLFKKKNTRK